MLRFALISIVVVLSALSAQATTLYVAGDGTNVAGGSASSCTNSAAPCLSLAYALSVARVGDTIVCQSTPERSYLSISKSVTIDCSAAPGVIRDTAAGIIDGQLVAVAIMIPPSQSDPLRTVRLRGLNLDGATTTTSSSDGRYLGRGIQIDAAAAVYVEDCVIANMINRGISDTRTGGQTRLYVKNTVISGNGGPGIVAAASQSPASTVLDNVSLLNNAYGIAAATGNNVVIKNSTISGNTTAGVHADQGAQIDVSNSTLSHNTAQVNAYGTVRLKENELQFSNVAIQGSGGRSGGANRFSGNASIGTTPALASGAPADVVY